MGEKPCDCVACNLKLLQGSHSRELDGNSARQPVALQRPDDAGASQMMHMKLISHEAPMTGIDETVCVCVCVCVCVRPCDRVCATV